MNHVQGMVLLSVLYCASTGSLDGSLQASKTKQPPQSRVHVAMPTSAGVGKEFSPKDISVDKVIDSLKNLKDDFNYLSDSIIIPFPSLPGLAGFGSGWALEINWGFSGSGSILDGSFPPLRIMPRNLSSPDVERNIQLSSQLAQIALGSQNSSAFDAFEAAQKGGVDQGSPLSGILSFLNVDAADNPWIVYGLKVLALLKHAAQHNLSQLKTPQEDASKTPDFMLLQKNAKFLDILREFTRLSLRLFFSLKVSMSSVQHQAILDLAPDWVRDSMGKLSVLIHREPAYLEGFINSMWHDVWRYYNVSFDNKGQMHNAGPAVFAIRFENGQDASEYQRLWNENSRIFASRNVDYSAKFFAQFFQRQAQSFASVDVQKGSRLQELANNVLNKVSYHDFGLVDKNEKRGMPAEFYQAALQHKPTSLLPNIVSVPLKSSLGTEHWVLFVTNTLSFRETLKIMGAIMLQGGVKVAKAWDRVKYGMVKQEYAAVKKAEADLATRARENSLFLNQAKGTNPFALLARSSEVAVEKRLENFANLTLTPPLPWDPIPGPDGGNLTAVPQWGAASAKKKEVGEELALAKNKLEFVKKVIPAVEAIISQLTKGAGMFSTEVVPKSVGQEDLPLDVDERLKDVEGFIGEYSKRKLGWFKNHAPFIQEFIGVSFGSLNEQARRALAGKLSSFKGALEEQKSTLEKSQKSLEESLKGAKEEQLKSLSNKVDEVTALVWNDKYIARNEDAYIATLCALAADFERAQAHLARLNSEGAYTKGFQKNLGETGGLQKHMTNLTERVMIALDTMGFFAEKMGKNAESYLALRKKIYTTEQERLREKQKDFQADESLKKLLWSRIDYLGDQIVMVESQQLEFESRERNTSVSKHKYEQLKLKTAFFEKGKAKPAILDHEDTRSYAAAIVSLAEYIQWLVNYTSAGLDNQRNFWSRTNEQYKAYWEKIRTKVPEFKQIRQELINNISTLFSVSPALQQAPKVAIWFFEVFFESILGRITEQDIALLERKDVIALSAEDAAILQTLDTPEEGVSILPAGPIPQKQQK